MCVSACYPLVMSYPEALAEAVINARAVARIRTAKELAARLGVSTRLVGEIENARRTSYSKLTLAKLDTELGWPLGYAEHLLRTGKHLQQDEPRSHSNAQPENIKPWQSIENNGKHYLQVTAAYDSNIGEEDLTRIALNARHYMREELSKFEVSEPHYHASQEPVFALNLERYAADDPTRHHYPDGVDEDEANQIDP